MMNGLKSVRAVHQLRHWLQKFLASLNLALDSIVPWGYEDRTGFHFGECPTAWRWS